MKTSIFCKSFRNDFEYLQNMFDSYEYYCEDEIPLVLSLPKEDIDLAKHKLRFPKNLRLVDDESYVMPEAREIGGWAHQQVCKLSIYKIFDNDLVMAVDSDTYFIRKITKGDFISNDEKIKLIASPVHTKFNINNDKLRSYLDTGLVPNFELNSSDKGEFTSMLDIVEKNKIDQNPDIMGRAAWIYDLFNVNNELSFMPSQIFEMNALRKFDIEFCKSNGITLKDIISISPWEYIWYGCWVISNKLYDFKPTISPAIHFASESDVKMARDCGMTENKIAERFLSIAMASRHLDILKY